MYNTEKEGSTYSTIHVLRRLDGEKNVSLKYCHPCIEK